MDMREGFNLKIGSIFLLKSVYFTGKKWNFTTKEDQYLPIKKYSPPLKA